MPSPPRLVFIDVETTGGSAQRDRLTEVGWVEVHNGQVRRGQHLVNPEVRVP
ncbi:MAG: exonuclease domain-containing protein, partial [Proteobacteria bacterium]|nr:exonuclease domain-containing protein [Pseudomonadota bacterium]